MSGEANRRRGHDAERAVVRYLRAHGWSDACTTRSKLGHDGSHTAGDVDFAPGVALEVKDVAQARWPSWRAQCVAEAGGRIPVVVRRTRGVTDVGQWATETTALSYVDLGGFNASFTYCARTECAWVRTTFSDICALLAVDH